MGKLIIFVWFKPAVTYCRDFRYGNRDRPERGNDIELWSGNGLAKHITFNEILSSKK